MKQRFRARELWLVLPFLLIGALAFYWARVEQVSKPGARGMFVSDFKLEAAPGYWQEKGFSHQIVVTVSHPWPRPKWWGAFRNMNTQCDPLHPESPRPSYLGATPDQWMASGGALTVVRDGKSVRWRDYSTVQNDTAVFENNQYRFVHRVRLSEVPATAGAVTFQGLYRIGAQPQLALKRVVRKAGQSLPVSGDRMTGAQLVEINATPFFITNRTLAKGKTTTSEDCWVQFRLRDSQATPTEAEYARVVVYDLEVCDEAGQKILPYSTKGFQQSATSGELSNATPVPAEESVTGVNLGFAPQLQTKGRLHLRGKVSYDWHWPIKFEVKLPQREEAESSLGGSITYSVPLWRDGKPVEPPTKE